MVRKIKKTNIKNNKKDDQFENFLKSFKISELLTKINNFRRINFKEISYKNLSSEILKVLSHNNRAILKREIKEYKKGTRFYRIRKINQNELKIPLKEIQKESDAWAPPKEIIENWGRLNKPKESLLYTTPENIEIPIEEMKVEESEYFALIVYEAKEDIKVSCIGLENDYKEYGMKENEIIKARMLDDFLIHEFTRDVGKGTEYLYRISEIIAKSYFDLPPREVQDAWLYPSVASKKGYNVCFRPDIAKEKLRLLGVQILNYTREEKSILFSVKLVCFLNEEKEFDYYRCDSEKVKEVFPEINLEK